MLPLWRASSQLFELLHSISHLGREVGDNKWFKENAFIVLKTSLFAHRLGRHQAWGDECNFVI